MKSYEYTRDLLNAGVMVIPDKDAILCGLILQQHISWDTQQKTFKNEQHAKNWFTQVASQYMGYTAKDLSRAVMTLYKEGFMEITRHSGESFTIALSVPVWLYETDPDEWWEEVESPL